MEHPDPEDPTSDRSAPLLDGERGSLGAAFATTILASGGTILFSLISGILTARFLGTYGRGEVAAISSWTLTLSWASALGFANAMVYYFAKGGNRPSVIMSTTFSSIPVLGALGIGIAQILVPYGFAAQTPETQSLARIFLCAIPFVLGTESMWSLLMALQRFVFLGAIRVLQPLLYVITLVTLLAFDSFTPAWVLLAQTGSYAVTMLVAVIFLVKEIGFARPSWALSRQGLLYGLRLQGVAFGQLVTARLDLIMLPAFVAAAGVGYYSIAVNVASMVMSLFGALSMVVFPVASAAEGDEAMDVVARGTRLTLIGGVITVVLLGLAAPWLITLVYGAEFAGAVPPLWLLLPGLVLWACTSILGAGLQAVGKPGRASLAQVGGMVVTVVGLPLALPLYGIEAAAGVSTVAYTATFVLTFLLLARSSSFRLREAMAVTHIVSDFRWAVGQAARSEKFMTLTRRRRRPR